MSKNKEKGAGRTAAYDGVVSLDRVTRLLEMLVRLDIARMKGDRSQKEMIVLLGSIGCAPSEIAEILGTTGNTVRVSLHKAKKKTKRK